MSTPKVAIITISVSIAIISSTILINYDAIPTSNTEEQNDINGFVSVEGKLFTMLYDENLFDNPETDENVIKNTLPILRLDPSRNSIYQDIINDENAVFIYPTFTRSAYAEPGFYTFFRSECDESCLNIQIKHDVVALEAASAQAVEVLTLLNYDGITDINLDQDPSILEKYDKVILLHNEYVTKQMFDAITNHPKVIYLYPNALYAEIEVDYKKNSMSLIRGHNYPDTNILNGFDWEFDNTHPFEYDTECKNWEFYSISNGVMLNCYPLETVYEDLKLLEYIKKY